MITVRNDIIKTDTENTTLILKPRESFCEILYYGKKIENLTGLETLSLLNRVGNHASVDNFNTYNGIFSFFGDGNDMQPFVLTENHDGSSLSKFKYAGAEVCANPPASPVPRAKNSAQTLVLRFVDAINCVEVSIFVETFEGSDILSFSSRVKNTGEKKISVKRLFSVQIEADGKDFNVLTLDGAWVRERKLNVTRITAGTFVSETVSGFSSNKHNPFVAVKDNARGSFFAFNTVWSGNHKFVAEVSPLGYTRFLCGMNDFAFSYVLDGGEELYSPCTAVTFAESMEKVTESFHRFVANSIIGEKFRFAERPVLINNWEAAYFDFDREKLLSIARLAKECGIELFVVDDGWFVGRDGPYAGLGDWRDNARKTGGIDKLSADVKALGLKFGIWVEPEMVNRLSEIYSRRPDFAMARSGSEPIERRDQLVLDMVNPEVSGYIFGALCKVFDKCKPDYVKWDCNRFFTDIYGKRCKNAGTYCYKYALALYSLFGKLSEKYPDILFEGCSAGGNRFDLGILSFMPQIWASDNTDARERTEIQSGTLLGYPQSAMTAHVSVSPNHQTGNETPLKERFIVACGGNLGYELDITKLGGGELEEIKRQVAFYKKHRRLFQFGVYKRLRKDEKFYIQSVSAENGREAVVSVVQLSGEVNSVREKFSLGSFDKSLVYDIEIYGEKQKFVVSGEILSAGRLDFSQFLHPNATNAISAMLIYLSARG